jgi:hypothetical protein
MRVRLPVGRGAGHGPVAAWFCDDGASSLDATPTSRLVVREGFDCIPVGVRLGGGDGRTPE